MKPVCNRSQFVITGDNLAGDNLAGDKALGGVAVWVPRYDWLTLFQKLNLRTGCFTFPSTENVVLPARCTSQELQTNALSGRLIKWTPRTSKRLWRSSSIYSATVGKKPSGNVTPLSAASFAIRNRSANGMLPRFFQLETTLGATDNASATLLGPPKFLMMSVCIHSKYHML